MALIQLAEGLQREFYLQNAFGLELQHQLFPWFLVSHPALQILNLLASTITWANSLKSLFLYIYIYIYIYIYFFFFFFGGGVGQKINLGFSIRCYRKTNPKELLGQPNTYRYAHTHYSYWKSLWDLVACCLKARKQARVVERKVRFISDVGNWWVVDICPEAHFCPQPLPDKQGMRAFIEGGGSGWMGRATCRNSIVFSKVIFRLVIIGLTSIILLVLGSVNLQFQGPFFPISLWPVLKIVAAHVLGAGWSSCS